MSKMWMPSKPAPTSWPPHVCVAVGGRVPGADEDVAPDDDVALTRVMGALLVVAELDRVRRIGGVDDAEAVPVALDDEVALERQVRVDGGEAGAGHVAGREADRRHVVAVRERGDGGADRIGRGGRLDRRGRLLRARLRALDVQRLAGRQAAAQLDVASIDRKAVDPPVALRHGCALAAAGSRATAITATARLTRPTIPFFGATGVLPLGLSVVRRLIEVCPEHARHTSRAARAGRGIFSTPAAASMARVIARPPLPPGPLLVVGLARSGVAAALALRARGAEVVGCDAQAVDAAVRAELEAAGRRRPRALRRGRAARRARRPWSRAPGSRRRRRWWSRRGGSGPASWASWRSAGACWPNDFVAITGSNGKTTTTELVGHIHREAGAAVVVAGNVGTALTTLPGTIDRSAVVVCEASSFQLEDTEAFAPDAAILLNLAEDHLDRYRTVDAYRAAKLQAFARQPPGALAVAPPALVGELGGAAERVTFGPGRRRRAARRPPVLARQAVHGRRRGAPARRPQPRERDGGGGRLPRPRRRARRRAGGLASFAGVPHRLEEVATIRGVLYVNDSKATNVASAVVGIESFAGGVARHPRRPRQAQRLSAARRAAGRAGARGVPDRRGRARDRRRAGRRRRAAARLRRPGRRRSPPRAPPRSRATSCCSRRPAPRTTSTGRSRSAASISGRSSKGDSGGRRSQA